MSKGRLKELYRLERNWGALPKTAIYPLVEKLTLGTFFQAFYPRRAESEMVGRAEGQNMRGLLVLSVGPVISRQNA